MTFWTYFWLFVPPVVLIIISVLFYFLTGKKEAR